MTRVLPASTRKPLLRLCGLVLTAALGLGTAPAQAADATFSMDFSNAYVWRGITFNDSGVAQFALDAGTLDAGPVPISFNVWTNLDIGDYDGQVTAWEFSEIDLTISAALPYGFGVGYVEYHFPGAGASTREIFVSWSKEYTVTPTVTFFGDVGSVDSYFMTLDLTYSRAINDKTGFDIGGYVSLAGEKAAEAYAGGEQGGFYNYDLMAGISYAANETLGLSVSIHWTDTLDTQVLPEQDVGFYAVGGLSFAF
jgi:hypothetical protein